MRTWLRQNVAFIGFLLFLGVFRTAVADWNPIPSSSMRPNLLEGDVVFVNRLAYDIQLPLTDVIVRRLHDPQRGDIVTFASPSDGTRLIKRIVAVPGDRVQMMDKRLFVNGAPLAYTIRADVAERLPSGQTVDALRLNEQYGEGSRVVQWIDEIRSIADFGPIQVPADHFFMLGDNRDVSGDSRYFGLVPRHLLIGRAERVLVSADILTDWSPRFDRFGRTLY